jgi:phage terminase large subunit-like protein
MFDPKKYPFCNSGHQYALDVVSGKIPNSKYIVGACLRYFEDLKKGEFPFDADAAEKYLRLVQKFEHVKGEWNPKHILYQPWQNFIFMNIMGFINPTTGKRRFRIAHIEVSRGSGKSMLASQAALFFLALDNPIGNEISCSD